MTHGKKIINLKQLAEMAANKKAVIVPASKTYGRRPNPAAWMIHLPGIVLLNLFTSGMYEWKPPAKIIAGRKRNG